ncbi:UNVERIFIED_CONTAM: hypothetical protein HDU68_005172, partial [Siphonaria sp. JEL0065]
MVAKKKTSVAAAPVVYACYSFLCNHTTSNGNACYSYDHLAETPAPVATKKTTKKETVAPPTPSRASKRTKSAKVYKESEDEAGSQEDNEEDDDDQPKAKKQKTSEAAASTTALTVGGSIPADFPSLFTQAHEPFSLYEAAQAS